MTKAASGHGKETDAKEKQCFVITPIGAEGTVERRHADMVLGVSIEPAFNEAGFRVERADLVPMPGMISDRMFDALDRANICVADLTFLNPNVFYELAIRHALAKPIIHIAATGTTIPFDTSGHRTIRFDPSDFKSLERLRRDLIDYIAVIESDDFQVSNPFTQYLGAKRLSDSGDTEKMLVADLLTRIEKLERYDAKSESMNVSTNPLARSFQLKFNESPSTRSFSSDMLKIYDSLSPRAKSAALLRAAFYRSNTLLGGFNEKQFKADISQYGPFSGEEIQTFIQEVSKDWPVETVNKISAALTQR